MPNGRFRIEKPSDFNEYWKDVVNTATRCDPEVAIERWELEDPNFEAEYILDGNVPEKGYGSGRVQSIRLPIRQPHAPDGHERRKSDIPVLTTGRRSEGCCSTRGCRTKKSSRRSFISRATVGNSSSIPDFVTAGYAVFNFSHRGMHWGSKNFDRYHPDPSVGKRRGGPMIATFYRSVVIDCLLAVEVLRKIELCGSQDRIGVMGTSQGGALSVITTVLDKGVKAASADIPWMTNYEYQLNHMRWKALTTRSRSS